MLYSRSQQIPSSQALQGPAGAGYGGGGGGGYHSAMLGWTQGGTKDMPGTLACICTV